MDDGNDVELATQRRYDVVIVGAGHNGLVAAAYLARAGLRVVVLEQSDHVGGAAISASPFDGVDVRLSRYAYLVSLLPDRIVADLGLSLQLRSRAVASYSPSRRDGRPVGLFVGRGNDAEARTEASFEALTGSRREYERFRGLTADLGRLAAVVAPTLLEPVPTRAQVRSRLADDELWESVIERPLAELLETRLADDLVRGLVLTDGLIGTFARSDDPSRKQNACFLYHVIGNGDGEWRVPVGGMGAVTAALHDAARRAGAEVRLDSPVRGIDSDGVRAEVTVSPPDGVPYRLATRWVLCNAAPTTLARLQGRPVPETDEGCQVKVNLVVQHLPRLRVGIDPAEAFAGTFHLDEGYAQLDRAFNQAVAGQLPDPLPAELYCHSLTDPSILGPSLRAMGWHTLTAFVLHTPAALFRDSGAVGPIDDEAVLQALFNGLNAQLEEPIESCLARDRHNRPCVEVSNPLELERELGLPGGNIFHGALQFPFHDDAADGDAAVRWGVETATANVFCCGSGARRGGAVSGIGGHNAAQAVLEQYRR